MENSPSSSRTDRKTIEKNRRSQMKALYSKLSALVPHQSSKEALPLPVQLDEATKYIKKLQIDLEKMREKKHSLMGIGKPRSMMINGAATTSIIRPPKIEIHTMGSDLEVELITDDLDYQFMFRETIRILHEGGADIVNASFAVVEGTVFHTVHCTIGGSVDEVARISETLKNFVCNWS